MASKNFELDNGLVVTIQKRRTNRNLRLSITPAGLVRVTIPAWAPYKAGLEFAKSRAAWIAAQHTPPALLRHGQPVGKAHHLEFLPKAGLKKPTGRIQLTAVVISYPEQLGINDEDVQKAAREACVRALRSQAEALLPQRLALLAEQHGFRYNSVSIKRLKGRWGSCDHQANIVLNLFLMQLPWDLIDYVLLHELTHTRILRHGPDFWAAMKVLRSDARELKKALRNHQPVVQSVA